MHEIAISSTGWLAIYLQSGDVNIFNLNDTCIWQYLEDESTTDQLQSINCNSKHLNRHLIKYSPNGEIFVFTGLNKQLYIYGRSDYEKHEAFWKLMQRIQHQQQIFALDLNDEFLLIADTYGDIYKINLSFNSNNDSIIVTIENRIMSYACILFDIIFLPINDEQSFIFAVGEDEKIRWSHYPNSSDIKEYSPGHTEFISHIKLIDSIHILSASGDGKFLIRCL